MAEALPNNGHEAGILLSNSGDFQNFIKCHHALKSVCTLAVKCLKKVFTVWHSKVLCDRNLNVCETPDVCSQIQTRPDKQSGSCDTCYRWVKEIEKATFPQNEETLKTLSWKHINSSRFHESALEVAKVYTCGTFSRRVTIIVKDFTDFDHGDLLKIMKTFSGFLDYSHERQMNDLSAKDDASNFEILPVSPELQLDVSRKIEYAVTIDKVRSSVMNSISL